MEWLLAPIDPSRGHDVGFVVSWHGRLMVIAWSMLFPCGILAARFFKITPRQNWPAELDNIAWWRTHLISQYAGAACIMIAIVLILVSPSNTAAGTWHQLVGWVVVSLCGLQFISGWLRGSKGGPTAPAVDGSLRGDHFDMTLRRRMFEYFHKTMGYIVLLLACVATVSGLWLANAQVWMWLVIVAWWLLLLSIGLLLQSRGACVDTYQAIWGPEPSLPGNQRQPIGIGIKQREK